MARYACGLLILVGLMLSASSGLAHGDAGLAHTHGDAEPHNHAPASAMSHEQQLEAVYGKIIELQEQLDHYQHEIRLRDVLGGLGYIVGISGVAFYFLGARRKQSRS